MRQFLASGVAVICLVMAVTLTGCNDATEKLKSSDKNVVTQAIREIADWDTEQAVTVLTDFVKTQSDEVLAARALRALGGMHRPEAAKALCELAKNDKRATIRSEAVTQVGRRREASYAKDLFEPLAATDPDPYVRSAAVSAILELNRLADIPMLLNLAQREDAVVVQARAVAAVEKLLTMKSAYNPAASPEQRLEAIARLQTMAVGMAASIQREREKTSKGK
jgi:HEAT repeat protein